MAAVRVVARKLLSSPPAIFPREQQRMMVIGHGRTTSLRRLSASGGSADRNILNRFSTWLYELDPAFKATGVLSLFIVPGTKWMCYKIEKDFEKDIRQSVPEA